MTTTTVELEFVPMDWEHTPEPCTNCHKTVKTGDVLFRYHSQNASLCHHCQWHEDIEELGRKGRSFD